MAVDGHAAQGAANPILGRLGALRDLPPFQADLLARTIRETEAHAAGAVLHAEGSVVMRPVAILAGWAIRQRLLSDGRRQILAFHLPGDLMGVSLHPHPMSATTAVALTDLVTADASELREVVGSCHPDYPDLLMAVELADAEEEARLLDHVVRLGRLTAYERLAHFLLEMSCRLDAVGLRQNGTYPFPLTQEQIGDALGLSAVHVNRTLQQLRRDGLVTVRGSRLGLVDRTRLAEIAEFLSAPPDAGIRPRPGAFVSSG